MKTKLLVLLAIITAMQVYSQRPLIIVETDIGGDADDQATLARFLMYANEFDIKGIIINNNVITNAQNLPPNINNPSNAANCFEMAIDYIQAYGQSVNNLNRHVPANKRFPSGQSLINITKRGMNLAGQPINDGVNHIINVFKQNPNREIWYTDWGTPLGAEGFNAHSLNRALDRIRAGGTGLNYNTVISNLRFVEFDNLYNRFTNGRGTPGSVLRNHINGIKQNGLALDTFSTGSGGAGIWYRQWRGITDDQTYVRGLNIPLARLYTIPKEGDTMCWTHLIDNGINVIGRPDLGGWAGRYTNIGHDGYYKCSVSDTWRGSTNSKNTLIRWGNSTTKSTDIINDFRARWQWASTSSYAQANHHPVPNINGNSLLTPLVFNVDAGDVISLDASGSSDPDGNSLSYQWYVYNEISIPGARLSSETGARTSVTIPGASGNTNQVHVYVRITDNGTPSLARYKRVIFNVSGCPDTLAVTQNVTSGISNQHAGVTLTASNTISAGATANYKAGNTIILKSGFRALEGSNFTASIEACTTARTSGFVAQESFEGLDSKLIKEEETNISQVFKVYPNPAKESIQISYPFKSSSTYTASLYGVTGQLVLKKEISTADTNIDIRQIPNGVYVLKISSEDVSESKTIVVQK